MHESEKWNWSRSVLSDSSRPHGLQQSQQLKKKKKKKESEDHNNEKTSTGNSNKMIQDILTPGSTQCY